MSETSSWVETVRRIVAEVSRSDATELELSQGSFRLLLRRRPGAPITTPVAVSPVKQHEESPAGQVIVAPLTGIFYRSPSPSAPPYVEEGDWVESQTVVGLIETMKVFNEVTADLAGRVVVVHAQSGQLVHAGDLLMGVEPSERPAEVPEVMS